MFDSPGALGTHELDPARAPDAAWVSITPFGLDGPARRVARVRPRGHGGEREHVRTGDPDRAPVRCTEPAGVRAHRGEAAFAALTALWSGQPQRVDVSMQEVVLVANMVAPANFPKTGNRGSRRGANIGRTREIWPTLDGFVSFGLRGGKARVASLETLTKLVVADGIPADALTSQDWTTYNQNTATDEELDAIETAVAEYFSRHTMQELYDIACETNLMLAPGELAQGDLRVGAARVARASSVRSATSSGSRARSSSSAPPTTRPRPPGPSRARPTRRSAFPRAAPIAPGKKAWDGVHILEFGSGAAGPIATRYFSENGATVLRIESRTRPDFLRAMALAVPDNPHGLEGAPMYDGLNVGKRNLTLNLKQPAGVELVRRLVVEWADAVAENFAPRAMKGFGLDYDSLAAIKPDLVMMSACLNGQTGPHKDYPGFGGQGSALAGYNALTGWPDREPVGPYGTITDSLAPRYVAAALAAGLHYRRRTGHGVYLDLSQVESAIWTLAPWLLDYEIDGVIRLRDGNHHRDARAARRVPRAPTRTASATGGSRSRAGPTTSSPALHAITGDDVEAWTRGRRRARRRRSSCRRRGSRRSRSTTSAICTTTRSSRTAATSSRTRTRSSGPGSTNATASASLRVRAATTTPGPTLGQDNDWVLARGARSERRRDRRIAGDRRGGVS